MARLLNDLSAANSSVMALTADINTGGCGRRPCPRFYYAYGDGSLVATLYSDALAVPPSAALRLPAFTFGCAHTTLGEPVGVAGFGRGALSLPAQLAAASPDIGNYFSYCLISHSFDSGRASKPSPLILGRRPAAEDEKLKKKLAGEFVGGYAFTPMLDNPKHAYFYCVGLDAVTVGKRRIPSPASLRRVDRKGDGGMVVDSGTTFTMLPSELYRTVVEEFVAGVGADRQRAAEVEERTGLQPCFYGRAGERPLGGVPRLVLHFAGNSSVALPRRNFLYEFSDVDARREVGCLMVMDGGDEAERGEGPAGLLGNYQQQGFEVVYDLEEKRVGFARRRCGSMWDALN
ncbi:eukaryotic aspartyl protease family protein [Striga asiatica]|uniref:Eukaryotic aspartyl protease family protein n=1 Tax=Striga asiatica TaxID=4170 RepID=A0A5A7PC47_STRAF|nr:eukaryotic aspartyl protease family protein [Striga asiatica]